jgi:RimJ/RimL family protein N-acetyltransferase
VEPLRFPIATERLWLRPFVASDLDAALAIYGREDVNRYLDWDARSAEDVRAQLARITPFTDFGGDQHALRCAVLLRSTGELIGDVSLWQEDGWREGEQRDQAEIGFVFHPDHQGRGYAAEAMREMLRIGFERGGMHRIIGRCDSRNRPSAALMERLGMHQEGHLHENLFIKGEWTDELDFAVLAGEWRANRNGT